MSASPVMFHREYSAPTLVAVIDPFEQIDSVLWRIRRQLLDCQRSDGSWLSWRQSNGAMEAEALLLLAFLNRCNDPRSPRLMQRLFDLQRDDGGWPRIPGGSSEPEITLLAYFALRTSGLDADSLMLRRSRERLLAFGRGLAVSPRTRLFLALFGQVPHAGDWFNLLTDSPVEEWALQVLNSYRPVRDGERDSIIAHLIADERISLPPLPWSPMRTWNGRKAAQQLREFFSEESDTPAEGPTSVLPLMALNCLKLPAPSADMIEAWRQFDSRCRSDSGRMLVTPILAPQRDTSLALLTLLETGMPATSDPIRRAGGWLWNWLARGQARGGLAVADIAWSLIALARSGIAFQGDNLILVEHVIDSLLDEQDDDGGWSSPELTGLALEALSEFSLDQSDECIADAIAYLERTQGENGGWKDAAGANCLMATLRALCGLRAAGIDSQSAVARRAASWLKQQMVDENSLSATRSASIVLAMLAAGEGNVAELNPHINLLLENHHGWQEKSIVDDEEGSGQFDPQTLQLNSIMALAQFRRHWAGFLPTT